MSEMIERVARVLAENQWGARNWADFSPDRQAVFRDEARAAIEAMREPTEAMARAGHASDPIGCDVEHINVVYPAVWRGMIDAALA